jgi:hypothetical protein
MGTIERCSRQLRVIGIALGDLDVRQAVLGDKAACQGGEMGILLDAEHRAGWTGKRGEQARDMTGAAAEVHDTFARSDPDSLEQSLGLRGENATLVLEPRHLCVAATEQIRSSCVTDRSSLRRERNEAASYAQRAEVVNLTEGLIGSWIELQSMIWAAFRY